MAELDDRLKAALAVVKKALGDFDAITIQCEFRDNQSHCTNPDYPDQERVMGVLNCAPCLYAWCPRAQEK